MAWARLDDRFHEHWKVAEAGLEATGLWTLCLTWASQARRTSPTPGVVPESVIARFAGGAAKGRRLVARLHKVGMFDDKTDDGWPIHDFDDYLPRYDAEANRERGRRGGHAKAAKQTASKPLAEPPSEPPEKELAKAKQTSGMRASVRRNPVPVPSEEAKASSAPSSDSPNSGKIIKDWIDRQRRRPAERVVGQVAKQVRELLDQDFTRDEIDAGLDALDAKQLHPSTLSSLVSTAANTPRTLAAVPSINPDLPPWEIQ